MGDALKAQVIGARELDAAIEGLKLSVSRRVLRKAQSKAATPLLTRMKENAKAIQRTGSLWRALSRKQKTYKNGVRVTTVVGPRSDYVREINGQTVKPSRYAHLVEFGTPDTTPKPFMRPALAGTKQVVESTMASELGKNIEIEARKAALKAGAIR